MGPGCGVEGYEKRREEGRGEGEEWNGRSLERRGVRDGYTKVV